MDEGFLEKVQEVLKKLGIEPENATEKEIEDAISKMDVKADPDMVKRWIDLKRKLVSSDEEVSETMKKYYSSKY